MLRCSDFLIQYSPLPFLEWHCKDGLCASLVARTIHPPLACHTQVSHYCLLEDILIYSNRYPAKHPHHHNRNDTAAGFESAHLYQLPPKPVLPWFWKTTLLIAFSFELYLITTYILTLYSIYCPQVKNQATHNSSAWDRGDARIPVKESREIKRYVPYAQSYVA